MATKRIKTEVRFGGGWATDLGLNYPASPGEGGVVTLPFLTTADNVYYELDGGPHKIGGGAKVNSTSIDVSTAVMGVYDYWKSGVGASPVQKRLCHAGTVVYKEDLDGTWDSLITGLVSDAIPCYTTFKDIVIISSSATADGPRKWDQSTAAVLGGSPPNFAFSTVHKGRVWASGNPAFPSRVYYTNTDDPEDWAGGGSIDVSPDDGDIVTGLYGDFRNVIWVFKGPNHGSIHYITGSTDSDFARVPFARGVGSINHNGIIQYMNDLAFPSNTGIYSLAATEQFGDFKQAALTRPITTWYADQLSTSRLKYVWGVEHKRLGICAWTFTRSGYTTNNVILMMDYRFNPPRWSKWSVPSAACLANVIHNNKMELWAGTYDGYAYRLDQMNRDMVSTSYTATVAFPYLNMGSSQYSKTIASAFVGLVPKGNYNLTLAWRRDRQTQQSTTIQQSGSDVLGPASSNVFTLDSSTLGGNAFITQPANLSGSFRDIQFEFSQGTINQDMEVHSLGLHYDIDSIDMRTV